MARSKSSARTRQAPHVGALLFSLATICLLGLALLHQKPLATPVHGPETNPLPQPVDIGIEHRSNLGLRLSYTISATPGFVEVSHDGDGLAQVNLPDTWKMRAVRYGRIEDVTKDASSGGYIRWHLPAHAILSLVTPSSPKRLRVFNVSLSPLELRVKRIDLRFQTASQDLYLLGKNEPFLIPD